MHPGWIEGNKYSEGYSIHDIFKDQDGDGLRDIEEQNFKVKYNDPDSDDDGYSDYWEVYNRYNPLDKNSPGKIKDIAIDGIIDDFKRIAGPQVVTAPDRMNDNTVKKGFDIKNLFSYYDDTDLYIAASFYNTSV